MKGTVTTWRFWPSTSNSFNGIIWRRVTNSTYAVVGMNAIPSSTHLDTEVTYTVPTYRQLQVEVGDYVGFYFDSSVIRYNQVNGDVNNWDFSAGTLQIGSTITMIKETSCSSCHRRYSLQAVVSGEYTIANYIRLYGNAEMVSKNIRAQPTIS